MTIFNQSCSYLRGIISKVKTGRAASAEDAREVVVVLFGTEQAHVAATLLPILASSFLVVV